MKAGPRNKFNELISKNEDKNVGKISCFRVKEFFGGNAWYVEVDNVMC